MDKHWYWFGAYLIVGILLGVGVLMLVTRSPRGVPITLSPAPTPAPITVYVSGNVNHEGLYSLPAGSRINDAIQAAGGLSEDADSSSVNLAEILTDGQQIIVPKIISSVVAGNPTRPTGSSLVLLDINTASLELLDGLPNIGPITAQDILDYRNAHGPFRNIEEIMDVPGIGQAKFDAIKELITVGTSP